jgi:hypothetical protein
MSRIVAVRSTTGIPSSCSRFRSWRGESSSSQATRFASEGVRVRPVPVLDRLPDDGDAGGPQQLAQLGEVVAALEHGDEERPLLGALAGLGAVA